MNRFDFRILPLLGIVLLSLLAGCAKPPTAELDAARAAVAQAYAAGAPEYAAAEYQAARAALDNAEQLSSQGKHSAATDILPFAEAQARQAALKARENRATIEAQRLKELQDDKRREQLAREKARREQEEAARNKVRKKVKAAPPSPVDLYRVQQGESLPEIAARPEVYNEEALWPLLYKANRDQITDPRRIYIGQELTVPRNSPQSDLDEARDQAFQSTVFPLAKTPKSSN